ncbi:hypothetical protein PFISCL1PPCAC_7517 [Pristionchus fissidentatus]|uniref:Protein kinase domain-containing protein n=1 Tax=Pristionchus fissidentatus TaxID=1538716 RepID=A0AAV5V9B4_9BILA|nr:hypothetical protein PFISCL1PPCAC_7517 [Pristionchus fissidentatus]
MMNFSRDILYLLVDKSEVRIMRLTKGPSPMILVNMPDPKSAGAFSQDHMDFLYILSKKTLLIIQFEHLLFTMDIPNVMHYRIDYSTTRTIAGIFMRNMFVNVMHPDRRTLDRYKVKLRAEHVNQAGDFSSEDSNGAASNGLLFHFSWNDSQSKFEEGPNLTSNKGKKAKGSALQKAQKKVDASRHIPEFTSKFLEKFKPTRIVGEGTFGIVFEAEHRFTNCSYAVKRVHLNQRDRLLKKALREATVMSRFDHRGIVRYFDSWIEEPPAGWQIRADLAIKDGLLRDKHQMRYHDSCAYMYIQMQLCSESLEDWLEKNTAIREMNKMKSWLKQLVEAVNYIHAKKIMHRDLKPSNILLYGEDQLKICDLGTATEILFVDGTEATQTRTTIGTELYKSPEQKTWMYRSKVDVFTLGLIFAELCVPMFGKVRKQIFDNYRSGKQYS